ncbi:MAG: DUF4058 family protein [Planctomycetaceae bacterium]|nr:DUF4058 family protein [Planctomycetaceae bacterium]
MHSPFPGMDPYLEAPAHWPDVHHELLSVARELLNRRLRPHYHVRVEERVYISDENDPGRKAIIPDLKIVDSAGSLTSPDRTSDSTVVTEPLLMTALIEDEIHEARLEVIDTNQHSVVTVIELLSPTNKISGSRGRASYEQERREVMTSSSHFAEIDLLRDGDHLHTRELLPAAEYFVHVSRMDRRPQGYVRPIRLHQRLPVIGIPLKPGDEDMPLDLQTVLATAWDRAAWDLGIDYRSDPVPPLNPEQTAWAHNLLTSAGLR